MCDDLETAIENLLFTKEQNKQFICQKSFRKRNHGVTDEIWDAQLKKQNYRCWFRLNHKLKETLGGKSTDKIVIDHDEITKKNRALVCRGCNLYIEHLIKYQPNDPLILEYLERIRDSNNSFINARTAKKYRGNIDRTYFLYPRDKFSKNYYNLGFQRRIGGQLYKKHIFGGSREERDKAEQKIKDELKRQNFLDLGIKDQLLIIEKYVQQYKKDA